MCFSFLILNPKPMSDNSFCVNRNNKPDLYIINLAKSNIKACIFFFLFSVVICFFYQFVSFFSVFPFIQKIFFFYFFQFLMIDFQLLYYSKTIQLFFFLSYLCYFFAVNCILFSS